MPFVHSAGRQIYYERHGQGHALVLLHGAGSNAATWWQQLKPFAQFNTCYTLDLRCFGRSVAPLEEFRIENFVADVLALLDQEGVAQAVVLGQSLGGMVALRMALTHPDRLRGLVLCDSSLAIDHPEQLQILRERVGKVAALSIEQRSLGSWFVTNHPDLASLYAQINHFNPSVYRADPAGWRGALEALNQPDQLVPMAALKQLACPALIVVGQEDPIVPVHVMQEVQALMPVCQLQVIEQAAHSAYFEQPARFNRCVLEFLQHL